MSLMCWFSKRRNTISVIRAIWSGCVYSSAGRGASTFASRATHFIGYIYSPAGRATLAEGKLAH